MGDRVGQQLGNYRLLRLLGQGSFADVYLGEHIHLGTQAAIKILQVRLVENNIQNFLNEARTIAHLVHPYIIRVLDFGVQDTTPFLVMDYAPKGTFRQRFLQGKPLPAAPLVSYMRQAAAALQYAHDHKLIHRDVKPENMLMGPNDEVLLTDFGFALIAQSSTSSSLTEETAGTATYMAPEQLQGRPRPASDQYALGIIAYEWLCGSRPFDGSFFEIASQHVLTQPPLLREKDPDIASEIEKVVMIALEKDPQRRFPSVRDFALALEDACLSARQYGFELPSEPFSKDRSTTIKTQVSEIFRPATLMHAIDEVQQSAQANGSVREEVSPAPKASSLQEARSTTRQSANASFHPSQPSSIRLRSFSKTQLSQNNLPPLGSQAAISGERSAQAQGAQENKRPIQPQGSVAKMRPFLGDQIALPDLVVPHEQSVSGMRPFSLDQLAQQTNWSTAQLQSASGMRPFPAPQTVDLARQSLAMRTMVEQQRQQAAPVPLVAPAVRRNRWTLINVVILLAFLVLIGGSLGLFLLADVQNRANVAANQANIAATNTVQHANTATARAAATEVSQANATSTAVANLSKNPYSSGSSVLVMNDPLTNNKLNNWSEIVAQANGTACQFDQEGYHVVGATNFVTTCSAAGTSYTNFTYEAQMVFTKIGDVYGSGGITFMGDPDTNTYYRFGVYASGKYSFVHCSALSGYCTSLIDARTVVPLPSYMIGTDGLNQTNTLAIVVSDKNFTIYVNKVLAIGPIANPYVTMSGAIGVFVTGGKDTPSEAIFKNVRVWK